MLISATEQDEKTQSRVRKWVQQVCWKEGFRLDGQALEYLSVRAQTEDDPEGFLFRVLETASSGQSTTLTKADVSKAILQADPQGEHGLHMVEVINVFDVPRAKYDRIRNRLFKLSTPPRIAVNPLAKQEVLQDRLMLLQQHVKRLPAFSPATLLDAVQAGGDTQPKAQLVEVKALSGRPQQECVLLGCLTQHAVQLEGGEVLQAHLEDLSGAIPLDLQDAPPSNGFITEGCVVLVEGVVMHNGMLRVDHIAMPPPESRSLSLQALQGLDLFGGQGLAGVTLEEIEQVEAAHREHRVVVLADVLLDCQATWDNLHTVCLGYESMGEGCELPALFVLMGNFRHSYVGGWHAPPSRTGSCLRGHASYGSLRDDFAALAALLQQYPRLLASAHFVFIPGPDDPTPTGAALPQAALPAALTAPLRDALPKVSFVTNPCRIRWFSQELVLFRSDVAQQLLRRCAVPPAGEYEGRAGEIFKLATHSLLQQAHLCPLPLSTHPIIWQHDHALSLYPAPSLLVLADGLHAAEAHCPPADCRSFNPGSLQRGEFAAYKPAERLVELNCLAPAPDDAVAAARDALQPGCQGLAAPLQEIPESWAAEPAQA